MWAATPTEPIRMFGMAALAAVMFYAEDIVDWLDCCKLKLNQFRTISLLNVEGKIFFAILARRLTSFLTGNAYINTSVQKGGVPGFSGCIEHTSAITQLINEAMKGRKDLTVVWLDLANAYGSIPHQLNYTALRYYHVDGHIQKIITSYLDGIKLRFTVGDQLTRWQKLEKGIVTGCTVSVVLFIMGMNLLINAAQRETRGPKTESGIYLPSSRGFMDDLTLTTTTHVQARWMLTALTDVASWGRMKFKAAKSRSLVIKKGQTTERFKLYVQNEEIPSIVTSPIKCLGKWFDASLQDRDNVKNLKQQVEEGLKKIDRCGLPGKFKAWLYQHALLPRLIWPLMLYEVPSTTVEALERITSRHLRKWLGVPPSFTSIGLYGKSNKLQLSLSSLVEEFKTAKARLVLTLRDSPDEFIREAGIQTRTSRKWSATESVSQAENTLKHKDIVGVTAVGREGIGARKVVLCSRSDQKERRAMIQSEVRRAEENARQARAVEMGAQGAWTTWNTADRKLTWEDIWKYEPFRFSFLLRSLYDLLPSPANLCRWGLTAEPKCSLCDRVGTLEHVLSSCSTALTQGRYRWRHDLVLRELADWLEKERKKEHGNHPRHGHIAFVKSGETVKTQKQTKASILDGSRDWKMDVDLDRRLVFPNVVQTTLRPDIVLWSETGKKLVTIELTVPWEARCEEAYERKKAKYTELMDLCKQQGWRTWLFPVEVGVRGFCSQSVHRLMTALGTTGRERRVAIQRLSQAAEQASSWLWLRLRESFASNAYINTSVQKGGVPGFSGCIEHTSAITQLINEAMKGRKDLTVVWLDLANAYGSIPHQLIYTALRHYHVDGHIQKIITSYLDGIKLRFTVGDQLTRWQKLEKGIVTGCTVSVVLFIMGMNLLINAAQRETRGPKTESGIYLPSSRGFMDDLTLTTVTHVQARWMLTALTDVASWGRMKFKAAKSRSPVIKKGQTTERFKLYVQNEEIHSIVTSPIKCLGKWFDASLQDRDNVKNLKQQVEEGLKQIDRCGLPGKFKA
ncbi:uncharacterized protein LOC127872461 [Dreissena polymorpha]|uniref:uncharacterized protein LOC127872461 n=1 Tax=Dreissena polymorpha TaxID=45954 RepID=UPI002264DB66|nr:uncharacterized protein LOC127872461 [Dreissena polymorpha]